MESTQVSIRQLFRDWGYLVRRKAALETQMQRQHERYLSLSLRITPDGIRSSIIQQTRDIDMPRGADVSDRTGNMVATVHDGMHEATTRGHELAGEYLRVCEKVDMIESYVAGLSQRHAEVVTAFYRDKKPWLDICLMVHVEKSRMYEMVEEAVSQIDRERMMWA